ncbi:MAG: zinc dependent phospholipase C family protein [Acutalibacteraceae bacterium]
MISHYLLARRVLRAQGLPAVLRKDAFLIGAQGPDILFFHRVYPWQPGKASFRLGNALHEIRPSRLFDTAYSLLKTTPKADYAVVYSYIQGLLCHYAADRTVHPFVCFWQEWLRRQEPHFAKKSNPYHYRIESALDGELLRHDTGQRVSRMVLTTVLPPTDAACDRAIGRFYNRLLRRLFGVSPSEKSLYKAVGDMRVSMWLMTDHHGVKRALLRGAEKAAGVGALLSPLLRSDRLDDRDYANKRHCPWKDTNGTVRTEDFLTLCDEATALSVSLISDFAMEKSGWDMTQDIDFAGRVYRSAAEG